MRRGSDHFQLYTNTQTQCTPHNSPSIVEDGLGSEWEEVVIISCYTLTQKHCIFHNSPPKVEDGTRKGSDHFLLYTNTQTQCIFTTHHLKLRMAREKVGNISSYTLTHMQTQCIFHNSPPKVEKGLGREWEEVVIISSCTPTHKHNVFFTTHQLKLMMDWEGNEKR